MSKPRNVNRRQYDLTYSPLSFHTSPIRLQRLKCGSRKCQCPVSHVHMLGGAGEFCGELRRLPQPGEELYIAIGDKLLEAASWRQFMIVCGLRRRPRRIAGKVPTVSTPREEQPATTPTSYGKNERRRPRRHALQRQRT